jgi:hypothetical protein
MSITSSTSLKGYLLDRLETCHGIMALRGLQQPANSAQNPCQTRRSGPSSTPHHPAPWQECHLLAEAAKTVDDVVVITAGRSRP